MACADGVIYKAVEYAKKHTLQETATKFKVSIDTVSLWVSRKKIFGDPAFRVTSKMIVDYVKKHPDETYEQVATRFGIYKSNVVYHCRAQGYKRGRRNPTKKGFFLYD